MASKYDTYWAAELDEIRAAVRLAATGTPATVSVLELRHLGARRYRDGEMYVSRSIWNGRV